MPTHQATRNRRRGAKFEASVAAYFATHGFPHAERRHLAGSDDRGDMAGVIDRDGDPWAVEVKDVNGWTEIAGHCAEAEKEAENAGVVHWIVVKRRRGTTDPGKAYVVSTLADWCAEHGVDL